jgi:hypothetical protein
MSNTIGGASECPSIKKYQVLPKKRFLDKENVFGVATIKMIYLTQ